MSICHPIPNRSYTDVRASFVRMGTSLNAWCKGHGVKRQWAEKVLKGERNGPKANALMKKIFDAVGESQ